MPTISDLPVEVVLDVLLPLLPNRDLTALAAINKNFAKICNDDTFWKRKCDEEFNFTGMGTARETGWKFIYKGLTMPKAYVWGNTGNSRLGLTRLPRTTVGGVPYPVHLQFPSKTIVNLVAGGWSFHALDSEGRLFVCGQLSGEGWPHGDGYSESAAKAETPLRVQMPFPIRSVSCGRKHTLALDAAGQVWTFRSWGRPFRLDTPIFDRTSEETKVVLVESGWVYCSVLMESGDVYVWWPFANPMDEEYNTRMHEMDEEENKFAMASQDGVIPSVTWVLAHNPSKLPKLPDLPKIQPDNEYAGAKSKLKLIKLAAMDNVLIGLTNEGHVLKFGGLSDKDSLQNNHWEYLSHFSELDKVKSHSAFNHAPQLADEDLKLSPPAELQITHISAHFEHFVAYSTGRESIVLMGTNDIGLDEPADIIPELQYKSIISVVLGDYHFAALTSDGKLYTWGRFSSGALGLGDPAQLEVGAPGGYKTQDQLDLVRTNRRRIEPPEVVVPSLVRFDHEEKSRKDKFCFAVAAAGWHTGALVLDPDSEESEEAATTIQEEEEDHHPNDPTANMPGHFDPRGPLQVMPFGPGHIPSLQQVRGHAPFRVGFAGRGRFNVPGGLRGRGMGQPPGDGQ